MHIFIYVGFWNFFSEVWKEVRIGDDDLEVICTEIITEAMSFTEQFRERKKRTEDRL